MSTRYFIPIWFLFVLLLHRKHTTILTKEKGMWLESPTAVSRWHDLTPAWQSKHKKQAQKNRTVIGTFLLQLDCYLRVKLELGQLQCLQVRSKVNTLIWKLTFMERETLTWCLDIITTYIKLYRRHWILLKVLWSRMALFKVFDLPGKREHLQHAMWCMAISE